MCVNYNFAPKRWFNSRFICLSIWKPATKLSDSLFKQSIKQHRGRLSGYFLGCSDIFQAVRTVYILTGLFPVCVDTSQTVWTLQTV